MFGIINRFSKYSVVILGFLAITLSHAQGERADDISILDVDGSGEVDALTDGLLLLRSMFGLTDDALATGAVDLANCTECDATGIDQYLSTVKGATYGKLNANDDQNISGSRLSGTTLTIGIEDGTSETVDLSSLEEGPDLVALIGLLRSFAECIDAVKEWETSDLTIDGGTPIRTYFTVLVGTEVKSCAKDLDEALGAELDQ